MLVALVLYGASSILFLLYISGILKQVLAPAKAVLAFAAGAHLVAIGWHHLGGLYPAILSPAGLLSLGVFVGVTAFLVTTMFVRTTTLGAFVATLGAVVIATLVNNAGVPKTGPHLEFIRFVTPVHIASSAIGFLSFGVAFIASALLLVADQRMRERLGRGWPRLPPISTLEFVSFTAIRVGFPFYTLGILLGSVWAYWGGEGGGALLPEYMLGIAVWFLYAILVLVYIMSGWRGRKAAVLTILGFLSTLPIVLMYGLRRWS
jgi:ABC-type uncharacterized transport system permease subunit